MHSYPFQGNQLFSKALDKILVEMWDKEKAMPKTLRRVERRSAVFHSFHSQHTLHRSSRTPRKLLGTVPFTKEPSPPDSTNSWQPELTDQTETSNYQMHDLQQIPVGSQFTKSGWNPIPKENGDWQAILDLKFLNEFVKTKHFHMEMIRWITKAQNQGEFLTSVDLTDNFCTSI